MKMSITRFAMPLVYVNVGNIRLKENKPNKEYMT